MSRFLFSWRGLLLGLLVVPVFSGLAIYWLPPQLVPGDLSDPSARFAALSDSRKLVTQGLGAFFLFVVGTITLLWTARRSMALEEQVRIARSAQVTDRIARAIEQIGATHPDGTPNDVVRAGGLGSLGRIAAESDDDRAEIISMFAQYLRSTLAIGWPVSGLFYEEYESQRLRWEWLRETRFESLHAKWSRIDVSAAIAQLARSVLAAETHVELRLDAAFIPELALPDAPIPSSNFSRSYLWAANFQNAELAGSDFSDSDLRDANFRGARLTGVQFREAELVGADFTGADLGAARFDGANVTRGIFRDASLEQAHLEAAYLSGADLTGAKVDGAIVAQPSWSLRDVKLDPGAIDRMVDLLAAKGTSNQDSAAKADS